MTSKLTNITVGLAVNRLRKLQRQWDYWFPLRAQYPFFIANWQQDMAEKECLRLGSIINELKRDIDQYDMA